MALRDTINRLLGRNQPQAAAADTARDLPVVDQSGYAAVAEKFKAETERANIVKQCRLMYKTESRVEKMHRTLARDTMGNGFKITVTNNPTAQRIAEELQKRLGLNQKLERYLRLTPRDGDSFLQIGVNEALDVSSFTRKPTLKVHRNTNEADQFEDPSKAFWMASQMYPMYEAPKNAIWFSEWELIHARWQWDEESRYGTPMMASSVGAFKRVSEGDIDVSVRRKTRAGMRWHHWVEGDEADIKKYKETNKAALNNPLAAQADYFSNKKGGIEAVQGDAHLNEIEDLQYNVATLLGGGEVPAELMFYGGELNRDILSEKKTSYAEILRQVREWTSDDIIKPLFERQWLLKGIMPEGLKYSITWLRARDLTPQEFQMISNAILQIRIMFGDEMVQEMLQYFFPWIEPELFKKAAQASGDAERFAANLKGLSI